MKKETIKRILNLIKTILTNFISIAISFLLCLNAGVALGNLGFEKAQIKLADEARINNEYEVSVKWYNKVASHDDQYSAYAHLAIAEIYSLEIANKEYEIAFQEYQKALNKSNDYLVLNSCMHFIIQQVKIEMSAEEPQSKNINILDGDHISFVVEVVNKMNETEPDKFSNLDISFPLNESDVKNIFLNNQMITRTTREFQYVETVVSKESGLAYSGDDRKLVYIDSWAEPISSTSSSYNVFYKYYKYKAVATKTKMSAISAFDEILEPQDRIYLSQLAF